MPQRRPGLTEEEEEAAEEAPRETQAERATRTINLLSITNTMSFDIRRQAQEDQLGFGLLEHALSTGIGESFNISISMDHELVKQGRRGTCSCRS